jgi:hypothetical protein
MENRREKSKTIHGLYSNLQAGSNERQHIRDKLLIIILFEYATVLFDELMYVYSIEHNSIVYSVPADSLFIGFIS